LTGNINIEDTDFLTRGKRNRILETLKLEKGEKSFIARKILFFLLVLWLPMLVLSFFESSALNSSIKISFLCDYLVYARFFIAIPLLLFAGRTTKFQSNHTINYFFESGIIADNNKEEFESLLKKFLKFRDSRVSEIIILIASYLLVLVFWKNLNQSDVSSSWIFNSGLKSLSVSGSWYYYISIPVYQFLFFRMIWRYILWCIFMWKISRMNLNIYATNPDLSAGLGFLGYSLVGYALLGSVQSCVISGEIANSIAFRGDILKDNTILIISSIISISFIYFFPSLFFVRKLFEVKLKGILDYGIVTSRQSGAFFNKWIKGKITEPGEFLDTPDFSSHTDMNTVYDIIQKMSMIPIDTKKIVNVIVTVAAPFAPLVLLAFPVKEIFKFVIKLFI
jgi:hypothetical protein